MEKSLFTTPPTLAAPGAGLPKAEEFLLRHLAMPMLGALIPWRYAEHSFRAEGRRIVALTDGLDTTTLTTRALVPRLMAMEDSSRYWSAAMTLQHLIVVGDALAEIIITLSQGRPCAITVDIAAVKPDPETQASVTQQFQEFLARFERHLHADIGDRHRPDTHNHPWMGALTAQQWLCLAGVHQRLHRRQVQLILKHVGGVQP